MIEDKEEYANALTEMYIWEEDFRKNWHLSLIFKDFKLLDLLEKKFENKTVFQTLENEKNQNNKDYIKKKGVYCFMKKILINIEFNYVISDKEKSSYLSPEQNAKLKSQRKQQINKDKNVSAVELMKKYLQTSKPTIDDETSPEDAAQLKYGITFYILPNFTFYLTNQSKIRFEENVDRTSKSTKAKGLITYIESFIFEMIVNQFMFKQNIERAQWISQINYFTFEIITFVFVCLHNIILLVHY